MTKKPRTQRGIHESPTFRALVEDLEIQTPEQVDRFLAYLELESAVEESNERLDRAVNAILQHLSTHPDCMSPEGAVKDATWGELANVLNGAGFFDANGDPWTPETLRRLIDAKQKQSESPVG